MAQDSRRDPREDGVYGASVGPMARTDGVLSRRLIAYLIDVVMIAILTALFGVLVGVLGLLTLGLGWALYVVLIPATAILYSAITVGGRGMGTIGMRLAGLRVIDAATGGRAGMLIAGVHALMFYVGIGTLLLLVLDILVGIARADRRLGHDLLAGLVVIRR